ncbi:PHD finger protein 20 [Nasonia vitripennis]|uniref:C2H2-type domain-containing protein n=1 Tax=Nasonia vitripennis TaxID=7425 RepID=A0A7M7J7L3_NASVI|nr:PHD finger protein 20 [Nasonia vitripennis]
MGDKLEAMDFNEKWYSARVIEIDWFEREVLINFDKWSSRFNEWIPMDSSRLHALQSYKEPKSKEFAVGERILATWGDGKKYPAKVNTALDNDKYNVLFDGSYSKILKASKITKLIDISSVGKFSEDSNYVGSKQERRDKKRKYTITELFHYHSKKKVNNDLDKGYKNMTWLIFVPSNFFFKVEPATVLIKPEALSRLDMQSNVECTSALGEDYATYIGNLRVKIEDSTYKCPKTGCNKNFRKENLLQMHIKHYHPEYCQFQLQLLLI